MTVNEAYNQVQFIVNKAQGGNATPARVNLAFQLANASLFKRYSGIVEVPESENKMAYSRDTDIEKVLRLFKTPTTLYINDSGIATLPDDFIKESKLTYPTMENGILKYIEVKVCNDSEFTEAQTSYVVPADINNPVCRFIGVTIEFAPKTLVNCVMTYLRMPVTPIWNYTIVNNRPVYSSSGSIAPEWPNDIIDDFIMLTCQYVGVNAEKNMLIQYTEQYKRSGQ